ncbi:MAG: hypothetical protein AAGD11_19125 [Planctomycetota bacterium]
MHQPYYYAEQKSRANALFVPLLILAHILIFSFSVTASNFPTKSFAHVLLGIIFSCVAACATLMYSKSNVPKLIAWFLVATCTFKLPICLIAPETTFLAVVPLEGKLLAELVCSKFFWFSLGFLGYAVGAIAASRFLWNMADPRKRDVQMAMPEKGFFMLLVLYGCLQFMRGFLLIVLQIGAPNVEGREFLIPKLAGILNILGTRGLLVVVAALLAWALARKSFSALLLAGLAGLTYAGVEMAGGWRSGLYYYGLCGCWIFLASEPSKLKNRLKPIAVGFAIAALLLFIPVMDFRHHLRRGMTQGEAFKAVLEFKSDDERNFGDKFHTIVRRFNGIDLYFAASYGSEDAPQGLMSLYNGAASQFFTFGILGTPEEAITMQGMTYWGGIAIALGDQWLWFMGVVLGVVIGGIPVLSRTLFYSPMMRTTFESVSTITLLHLAMGNVAFMLYFKELLTIVVVCFIVKLIVGGSRSSPQYYHAGVPYPVAFQQLQ